MNRKSSSRNLFFSFFFFLPPVCVLLSTQGNTEGLRISIGENSTERKEEKFFKGADGSGAATGHSHSTHLNGVWTGCKMTANCIHLFGWGPWRVARWSGVQTRAFVTRIRRRPTFPSFTLQPSPFPQGAAATDHHHHHLSFSFSPPTFDSPLLLHSASPEASLAFIEGAMSPFPPPPSQREGGLNGRTGETNRAASLFSDSSGTVRSVGVWGIRCIRARPISTRGGGV